MRFVHLLNGGVGHLLQAIGFALEGFHSRLESLFFQFFALRADEFFFGEGALHGEDLNECLFATFVIVGLYDVYNAVPDNVGDVHAYAFAHQGVASFLVNHGTLLVHHVVVFEQVLTNTEVVFLYLLLCTLYTLRNHWTFDALAILKTKSVHDACDTLRCEKAHQLVFERNVEYRRSGVALSSGTSTQLSVYTAAFVPFGTDDGQTASGFHFGRQLNVGTTTCHVCGNGHGSQSVGRLSGLCHDRSFFLVLLGIKHFVVYLAHVEHLAKQLGYFNRRRTNEHRATLLAQVFNLVDNGSIFLSCRFVHTVVHVVTCDGAVGRNFHHVKLVDVPEFASFGRCRTSHTSQFVVHTEVVL